VALIPVRVALRPQREPKSFEVMGSGGPDPRQGCAPAPTGANKLRGNGLVRVKGPSAHRPVKGPSDARQRRFRPLSAAFDRFRPLAPVDESRARVDESGARVDESGAQYYFHYFHYFHWARVDESG
jgi:hypothetical protein